MKFLQLNLGRGRVAKVLLMQDARERGADVLLISEHYIWSENSSWFQNASRRAGILVCSPDLSVGDFLESDAGFARRKFTCSKGDAMLHEGWKGAKTALRKVKA